MDSITKKMLALAVLVVLQTGCDKKHFMGISNQNSYAGQAILVAGQSNSVQLASQATPELVGALQTQFPGASFVIGCGVNGSIMQSWFRNSTNYINCMNAIQSSGKQIAAIVWWQGEAEVEALDSAQINQWPMRFTDLMTSFRKDLNNPSLPILYARLGDAPAGLNPYWDMMKQAQGSVMLADATLINLDGIPHDAAPNQLHYTLDGYRACAKRF
jgi:hypothetical protein